jgi:peptide chain release factor 1
VIPEDKLDKLIARHEELAATLAGPALAAKDIARLSKEYSDLAPVVERVRELKRARAEVVDLEAMANDAAAEAEMRDLAKVEAADLTARVPQIEREIQRALLPSDEAALFASELFEMYQRYAQLHRWRFEVLGISENDIGGYKEASASISGTNVFARLKFESGVHRVQRVPATETQGRIHTSTATVAVLPEAEEVDIQIEEKDLRIDVFRASGPGGQSVNTTDSAVRITHIPTGVVVQQQDEKSQHKNKAKALKILRARLYERKRQEIDTARAAQRKGQVGTGDRSERIRTYNFPQGRITDHRIAVTLYKMEKVMNGEALDEIIEPLITEDEAQRLAELQ